MSRAIKALQQSRLMCDKHFHTRITKSKSQFLFHTLHSHPRLSSSIPSISLHSDNYFSTLTKAKQTPIKRKKVKRFRRKLPPKHVPNHVSSTKPQVQGNNNQISKFQNIPKRFKRENRITDTSIRLYKMERRLTYLLSQYYTTLGITMNDNTTRHDDESSNANVTSTLNLPFYPTIQTSELASVLLHGNDYKAHPNMIQSFDLLHTTETLYQQIQAVTRQIIIGWMELYEKKTRPYKKHKYVIHAPTPDVAQYPIRSEIWLDKMEELRWERYQLVELYQDQEQSESENELEKEKKEAESTFISHFLSMVKNKLFPSKPILQQTKIFELEAHLNYEPTSSLYANLIKIHRKSIFLNLGSNFIVKERCESILQKWNRSKERGNINSNDQTELELQEEMMRLYARFGEKANEADELCQKILHQYNQLDANENENENENENATKKKFHKIINQAALLRLVIKSYGRKRDINLDDLNRVEELLNDLKELEKQYDFKTGSLATPEAYTSCFRVYKNIDWRLLPDKATKTQRLFYEISTHIWENIDPEGITKSGRYIRNLISMYNVVLSIYSSSKQMNDLEKAKSILQYMEKTYIESGHKFQIPPNTESFNHVLRGFVKQRNVSESIAKVGSSFLTRMSFLPDAKPNYETFVHLLALWNQSNAMNAGMQSDMIFHAMELQSLKSKDDSLPIDLNMYNKLLSNWGVSASFNVPNAIKRIHEIVSQMEVESGRLVGIDPELGESPFWDPNLAPDDQTYSNVIQACSRTGNSKDQALTIALSTYERMIQNGCNPDTEAMLHCINKLVSTAQPEKRIMLVEQVMQPVIENDNMTNALKLTLRKCSPDVYNDLFGNEKK